ncbi:MAG: HIT domain-containing protein [Bacteroidales bacterium]|nr:HIT domain-containing protein [Bacteroidales bacterium]MBO7142947.1 HIT domain-containing protein [Bacteroidales bacterium]MBO7596477.1 HIT domain-containing protein [Bacteroidales bacterium]
MATIFTRIINGEIPCYKIAENDEFFAFLDINPVQKGHTLVVPKEEVSYIFDINDDKLGRYMAFAKRVAAAIKAAVPCIKVGIAVVGLEVPHSHIHLIPLNEVNDLNFEHKMTLPKEEMEQIAQNIIKNFK